MDSRESILYINERGESLELGFYTNYIVTNFEEELSNNIITNKNANQDGETYINGILEKRDIVIDGIFKYSDNLERKLKRVFNPKLSGKLIYKKINYERHINVNVISMPEIKNSLGNAKFSIEFIACFPFWQDKEKVEYLAILTPKFKFPLAIPKNKGVVFGVKRAILETEIENIGDVDCGFRVVFKAKNMVKNPFIKNNITDEIIKISNTMEKGDIIEVINMPNRKMVFKNGEKAFKILDRLNTNFFDLKVGKNIVSYSADENISNLDVIVYYSPLYI
nr:phage tail domain-containing protein [uncultured Tyzzerella sp.]